MPSIDGEELSEMNTEEINEIKEVPMNDEDLYYYLPNLRLLIYDDLKKYESIESLLPEDKSYVVLLYPVSSKTNGHYACLYRLNDIFYYLDSYGMKVDKPLQFSEKFKNTPKILTQLFNESTFPIYVNRTRFQNLRNKNIASCGSYVVFFILLMLEYGLNMGDGIQLLEDIKDESNESFDNIIVQFISKR